ncbi:MAG: carboxypeptidase regulatory-like domain-containing protein [Acidobacteriota bacterium]
MSATRSTLLTSRLVRVLAAVVAVSMLGVWRDARPSAADGAIAGHVEIKRNRAAAEERPNVASLGAPSVRQPEIRPAVVYLDTGPRGAFEPDESARATMTQRDQTFVPHVLPVTVGTTVDFPNADLTFHNVFSLSKIKSFDLGRYAKGLSKSVRFDRPGVVQVFCDIHSHMRGFVLVFAHRFFAVTDVAGRYRIGRVPPGSYTLAVWYEGEVRETRPAVVPDAGGDVIADFVVR